MGFLCVPGGSLHDAFFPCIYYSKRQLFLRQLSHLDQPLVNGLKLLVIQSISNFKLDQHIWRLE